LLTGMASVYPQYLSGRKGVDAIGNVHRAHILLNVTPDSWEYPLYRSDTEYLRTKVTLHLPERCIQGINLYMPHTRDMWLKRIDKNLLSKMPLLPHLVKSFFSPHAPDIESRSGLLLELQKLLKRIVKVAEQILRDHNRLDKLTVRQEFTFASTDFFGEDFQWPLPLENKAMLCSHIKAASAFDMSSFATIIVETAISPLQKVFLRHSEEQLHPYCMSPEAKTALVFCSERTIMFLQAIAHKGQIHSFFESNGALYPIHIPPLYVTTLSARELEMTSLEFGLDPKCLPSVHIKQSVGRRIRSNEIYNKALGRISKKVFMARSYLDGYLQIIWLFQAYSQIGDGAVHRDGDEIQFGYFQVINFLNVGLLRQAATEKLLTEIAKVLLSVYQKLWLYRLNNKLSRSNKAPLASLPIRTSDLACLPEDTKDIIYPASNSTKVPKVHREKIFNYGAY
jgi:hypothetical protein